MLNKKLVALAVTLSILAAGSVYWYLRDMTRKMDKTVYSTSLVAVQDIAKNTVITEDMLKEMPVPQKYVENGALVRSEDAVGKVTLTTIFKGQQVLRRAIIQEGESKEGLAYAIPQGKRAVSVAVDEVSGIQGMIRPGDRVDVAATMDFKVGENDISQTSIVIQDIQVLAVGRILDADSRDWAEREGVEKTVTLAVTPKDAQPLILASERGSIRMMLRSPADSGTSNLGGLRTTDLLQGR